MISWCLICSLISQEYGRPDRNQPGDGMIQAFLAQDANTLEAGFPSDVQTWQSNRDTWKDEYLYMLGLSPMPDRTPLKPTVTGHYEGDGFAVENLHYQSSPKLYVTANLYRPETIAEGERLPTILYVCGHAQGGRDGNKTRYQSNGIWFARHGYVCLMVDTVQIGEIAGTHHGTYRESRWWWHSRGYTPAGVECWNGMRGLDYLVSRPDVDANRLGVTGISGGGAVSFWIAAADDRVGAAVPISGIADLPSYVSNRVVNGHCDCMFFHNAYRWPWVRAAALIAPRPMLFTNSHLDAIFPMDANARIANQLENVYSLYGKGDLVDSLVSQGGHAYRQDIRQGTYRFFNTHLKNDPSPITDSEVDLSVRKVNSFAGAIDPVKLRVFPSDSDIPSDQINTEIDRHFVPLAQPTKPTAETFSAWRASLIAGLRRGGFQWMPERIPAATHLPSKPNWIETEPGIQIPLIPETDLELVPKRIVVLVHDDKTIPSWMDSIRKPDDKLYHCHPRGYGTTAWTQKNPPNHVERAMVLLGRTADACRVYDVAAACRVLRAGYGSTIPIVIAAEGDDGVLAAYAALFEPNIDEIILHSTPSSHMDAGAPPILNALRTCDIPQILSMLAPRKLTLIRDDQSPFESVAKIYALLDAQDRFTQR